VLAAAAPAAAQTAVGVSAVSDYRYRGASLSDERPAASLSLAYDHRSGLYAGVKLIGAALRREGPEFIGYIGYAGYAVSPPGRPAFDAGVINYNLTSYRGRKRTVDYTEAYAGVAWEHVNAHLYYAPDYYQSGVKTLYADLSGGFRPTPSLKLFGHVGVLTPVGGRHGRGARKERYDFKLGAAVEVRGAEISLSWTRLTPLYVPRSLGGQHAERVAVGIAHFF
jgi:uncharacterized protein (TIGR02001 family)